MLYKDLVQQEKRSRRDADSLSPSQYGVQSPLVEKKYRSFKKDGNGFRVYNAWYQHKRENKIKNDPRVIVKHATDSPIRAHHRKSAAWSRKDHEEEDFLEFGGSMYSDPVKP